MRARERLSGMGRVRFTEHRGVRILLSDLSGLDGPELARELDLARQLVERQPFDSLLVLVDVTDIPYNLENVALLRTAAIRNRPYVRARAVVGLPEVARFSFRVIAHASGRKMEAFGSAEAALDWLVEQA